MDVTYNAITFALVRTNQLAFEPVWTPDRTAYLYTHVVMDFVGVLNPAAMAYAAVEGIVTPLAGVVPAQTIVAIRHALLQPRRPLQVTSRTAGGLVTVLSSPESGFPCDLNNGPVPGTCTITQPIAGERTWCVHWTCETWIRECGPGEPGPALLSNRYGQEDRIDDQYRSTRTTTGTAFFRTDVLSPDNAGDVADTFRAQVLPPVPAGFRRTRVNVGVVPARNALNYSCTDEETFYDLGDTAASGSYITKARVHFQLSSLPADRESGVAGGQSIGVCRVQLWGDKRASEWVMIQRAFGLAAGVLPLGGADQGVIQQIAIGKDLTDRQIDLNIVFRFTPPATAPLGGIPVAALRVDDVFGDFGGINPGPPWGKGSRGTANLKVLAAALETACGGSASPSATQGGDGVPIPFPDGPGPVVRVFPVDELPSFPTKYRHRDGKPGPYNEYHIESRYRRREGVYQAPATKPRVGRTDANGNFVEEPGPAAFFRVAAPTATLTVHWRAERVGDHPELPHPDNYDPNLVLLHQEVTPVALSLLPDQTPVFRVEGEYHYGLKTPWSADKGLALGAPPWIAAEFTDPVAQLDPASFVHGIADDAAGGPSPGDAGTGTATGGENT